MHDCLNCTVAIKAGAMLKTVRDLMFLRETRLVGKAYFSRNVGFYEPGRLLET